jgi:peptide chain release factor subunit 1
MVEADRRAFKKQLDYLSKFKGRHTEMISVYVPPGYELSRVVQQLDQEHGTATNIKSKSTKLNVMESLVKIIQFLKQFKKTPEEGLVVFAGNVSEKEGGRDIELFTVHPPDPIGVKIYKCAQRFFLEPLWEMTESKEIYGLLLVERSGSTVGLLKGRKIEVVRELGSLVFGKFRAGGQSAHRFEQQRENLLKAFFQETGRTASQVFLEAKVKGVIIGGPGPTKDSFLTGDYVDYRLKDKILGVKDLGSSGEAGLHELVERSQDLLKEAEVIREKNLVQRFLEGLGKGQGVAYGEDEVREALNKNQVDVLLLSEDLDWKRVTVKCQCGYENVGTSRVIEHLKANLVLQKCPRCGAQSMSIKEEKELVEELKDLAEGKGTEVQFISSETPEGQQLLGLGGIAALLRY